MLRLGAHRKQPRKCTYVLYETVLAWQVSSGLEFGDGFSEVGAPMVQGRAVRSCPKEIGMQSCNRAIVSTFVFFFVLAGCLDSPPEDPSTAVITSFGGGPGGQPPNTPPLGPTVSAAATAPYVSVSWTSLPVISFNVFSSDGAQPVALLGSTPASAARAFFDTLLLSDQRCYQVTGVFENGTTTRFSTPVCQPCPACSRSACEQAAVDQCTSLGFAGNTYCLLTFSQDCSAADRANAVATCNAHPEIRQTTNDDGTCRLIWF